MQANEITPFKILEMAKGGWDTIIELYKESTPELREKIIKTLGALAGFGALLKFLKEMK